MLGPIDSARLGSVSRAVVRVLAFAGARDVVGAPEVIVELSKERTAGDMFESILARYPGLGPYRGCIRLAVNGAYASLDEPVKAGDEIALIPPVAGG